MGRLLCRLLLAALAAVLLLQLLLLLVELLHLLLGQDGSLAAVVGQVVDVLREGGGQQLVGLWQGHEMQCAKKRTCVL